MLILTVIDSYKKKGRLNPENLKLEHMSDLTVRVTVLELKYACTQQENLHTE